MILQGPIDVGATSEPRCASPGQSIIPSEALRHIQALYDAGLCLQAYRRSTEFGPLSKWVGRQERVLAGRLAGNLGANRLAGVVHWTAWRDDKRNPDLMAYRLHALLHRRGPLAALEFMERNPDVDLNAPPDGVVHYFTVRAMILAQFRDFAASEESLRRATEFSPDHPWLATTRSHIHELQDRYAEALESAQHSLKLRPWYRPGIQAVAHVLQVLDRDEEALALLNEAVSRIENMHVMRELALLQQEHGQYDEAFANLARFEELAPLMEKGERLWLSRQRVTIECLRNNFSSALAGAKQIDEPFYRNLTERLEKDTPRRRVRLHVPFVRQHHLTCAPATLAALSRFWKRPAGHLSIAEAICYDGTPAHSERNWAETHGWFAREFTVTWESTVALLDRGIPFTLTTSEITSAHLQAVVGYDELRETLWIRDPFIYYAHEFAIKPLLEKYRSTGPRGMVFVPEDQRHLLDGIELPDAALYDQFYRVQGALEKHRREDALTLCREMQATAPDHRLTLSARRAMAAYDTNTPALLECIEQLQRQFPDDGNLHLTRLSCLRDLARREERFRILEKLCLRRGSDPVFWQQYAQELRLDARHRVAAQSWVRWALRYRPMDPVSLCVSADMQWDNHELAKATSRYRLAACLGSTREQFSRSFFTASRHLRETEGALQFLKERHERLGAKSSAPTITYIESLRFAGRTTDAFQVLQTALNTRPNDGAFRLFAADFYGRFSQFTAATEWLEKAKDSCPPVSWHRSAASLADYHNDKQAALQHWREVLNLEPLAHDAIRAATVLIAETESRERAIEFLNQLCERFPFSCPLLELRIQWVADDGPEAVLPHIRALLEINPVDAWAWRELALRLNKTRKPQEAIEAADEAIRVEPNHSAGYSVRGDILIQSDRITEGRADYRQALRLEVDNDYALHRFVETAPTLAGRKEALAVIAEELRRQVIFRDALSAYQHAARGLLPPDEVLNLLREAHRARPDLWQTWSVLINQLIDVGKLDEAADTARQATTKFPLLPRLWVDLSRLEQARLDAPAEIAALEKALELSPGYAYASRQLAGVYERNDDLAKARTIVEQAVAANPLDADNHGYLSHLLWKSRERDAAIERIQRLLRLQPGNSWAWNALRDWGKEIGRPQLAAEMARDLTRLRAGEARSWYLLARALSPQTESEEIFSALDRAVALNPRFEDAYDTRAWILSQLNHFDEALAACHPPAIQPAPVKLKIRAAWIETQRGNILRAIELAKAALEEHPDHYRGWQLLADSYVNNNQLEEAVQAAEKMAALAPLEAVPLGYLGDLKFRLDDKDGAQAAFQRAFTLDPDYQYAGFRLFHMQVAAKEYSAAAATLKTLSRHDETPQTISCAVELTVAEGSFIAARDHFRKLCTLPDAGFASLDTAAKALDNGQPKAVDSIINEQLSATTCAVALGELWVERQWSRGRWKLHSRLNTLQAKGEIGRRAILRYLNHLGEAAQKAKKTKDVTGMLAVRFHLWRVLRKHRAWLVTDVTGWGKVGYVLTCIGRPKPAIAWLRNWKERPEAESWMLYNLVIMLQQAGRYEECRDIIRHAVTLRHEEELYATFRLWAAFEEALAGNDSAAENHLTALTPGNIKKYYQPVEIMTRQLILMHQAGPGDKNAFFKTLRQTLRSTFSQTRPGKCTRYVRDGYRRFLSVAAREGGGWNLRLWGWWFYGRTEILIILGVLAAVPVTFIFPPTVFIVIASIFARRLSRGKK